MSGCGRKPLGRFGNRQGAAGKRGGAFCGLRQSRFGDRAVRCDAKNDSCELAIGRCRRRGRAGARDEKLARQRPPWVGVRSCSLNRRRSSSCRSRVGLKKNKTSDRILAHATLTRYLFTYAIRASFRSSMSISFLSRCSTLIFCSQADVANRPCRSTWQSPVCCGPTNALRRYKLFIKPHAHHSVAVL